MLLSGFAKRLLNQLFHNSFMRVSEREGEAERHALVGEAEDKVRRCHSAD